jgi:hypothetical protein
LLIDQARGAFLAKFEHVREFQPSKSAGSDRRCIGQRIGVSHVPGERGVQGGQSLFVHTNQQRGGRRRCQDFIEENCQCRMGNLFQTQRRLAHLTDAGSQSLNVFRAKIRVMRKSGF